MCQKSYLIGKIWNLMVRCSLYHCQKLTKVQIDWTRKRIIKVFHPSPGLLFWRSVTLKGLWVRCFDFLAHTHIIDDCCPQVTINDPGVCVCVCVSVQYVCVVSTLCLSLINGEWYSQSLKVLIGYLTNIFCDIYIVKFYNTHFYYSCSI